MFISRTTREERVTIETALDSAFLKIDQAEQLIYDLIDAFLSDREQKTLDKHDAQTIRNNLWIADDLLADAQLEYHLHAGHGDAPCVQQYLESAARAKANVEDEEAHNQLKILDRPRLCPNFLYRDVRAVADRNGQL